MQLTFTTEAAAITALQQINSNCGFPPNGADTWDVIQKAYNQELWFFTKPKPDGCKNGFVNLTYEQMMVGVVDYSESNIFLMTTDPDGEDQ